MKTLSSPFLLLTTLILFLGIKYTNAQWTDRYLTRGADTAEIYLSCQWYADDNYITWNGIFHSTDNGETFSIQRKTDWNKEFGTLHGDSTPGVLYLFTFHDKDSLGISWDYGKTFESKYFPDIYKLATGCTPGEVYIRGYDLYRSTDFGDTFTFQSSNPYYLEQDVGTLPGEFYSIQRPYGNPLHLAYSDDYGQTFTIKDVTFPGNFTLFDDCDIDRGTEPGELYFSIWLNYDSIALFHSFDYGQTVTFQSYFLQTWDEVFYTAGRTPGTYYIIRREICGTPPCLHSCLWVNFSRDYGVTFTTYFHDLDSTFTGLPREISLPELKVYPNPAKDQVTFQFNEEVRNAETHLCVFDLEGKLMDEKLIEPGAREIILDTRRYAPGIYCYMLNQATPGAQGKFVIVR